MHKRLILLFSAIFIVLIISVFILDFKRKQSVSLSSANYIGSCSVCNCLYELPAHQVCLIRQGQHSFCICPDCQEKQARGGL